MFRISLSDIIFPWEYIIAVVYGLDRLIFYVGFIAGIITGDTNYFIIFYN